MNQLLSLLQLSDPALPIGGYAHSSGLETYVQQGIVHDITTASAFTRAMLSQSLRFNDAAFVSLAYDAAGAGDFQQIHEWDHLCTAVKLPLEMRLASKKLGMRLVKIFQAVCTGELMDQYKTAIHTKSIPGNYCVAFAVYAHSLNIPKADALTGFYYNAAAGFITNCVKLVPLGQQDGQELLFSLQPLITDLVTTTMHPDPLTLGLSNPAFDIRCMQHETLYSRLYMS